MKKEQALDYSIDHKEFEELAGVSAEKAYGTHHYKRMHARKTRELLAKQKQAAATGPGAVHNPHKRHAHGSHVHTGKPLAPGHNYLDHDSTESEGETEQKQQNGCIRCCRKTANFFRFIWSNTEPLIDYETHKLAEHEPELNSWNISSYLKRILVSFFGILLFSWIIYNGAMKNGKLKSQSYDMDKQSILRYNMSQDLLPFHHFTEFAKFEVANRYECLVNGRSEPCVYFCNSIKKFNPEATKQDIWDCYVRLNVPKRLYG